MNIDWFTLAAQIINFLILLALLKRFLYAPILRAIDDREAEIAKRFDHLETEQSRAEATKRELDSRIEELTHAKQQLLAEAADEVAKWKSDRLSEAKQEAETQRRDWLAALQREREQLREELLSQYRRHAVQLAEGILNGLADHHAQELIVDSFLQRLREKSGGLATEDDSVTGDGISPRDGKGPVTVRSTFELSPGLKKSVAAALVEAGLSESAIRFRVDESLICGIELRTRDHEISWNVRSSVDDLAAGFRRELDEVLAVPQNPATSGEVTDVS